jgi:hypothetical protein
VVRQDLIAGKRMLQFLMNDIGTVARRHWTDRGWHNVEL